MLDLNTYINTLGYIDLLCCRHNQYLGIYLHIEQQNSFGKGTM